MEILSRAEWGAKAPRSRSLIDEPVKENWLHHTAGSEAGAAGMRSIQNFHMRSKADDGRGWSDIGYSWVYDKDERTWYEGRGWGVSGAHTYGHNSVSHGFCVMGDFNNETLSQANLEDIAKFIADAHKAGHGPAKFTGGHRDVDSTSCPGNNLYNKIGTINALITGNINKETNTMPERYDTTSKDFYQESYNWAVDAGIFSDHTQPTDEVTAEKLAVFLKRAAESAAFAAGTGPQGPQGPKGDRGPAGPAGPQGPAGDGTSGDHGHELTFRIE